MPDNYDELVKLTDKFQDSVNKSKKKMNSMFYYQNAMSTLKKYSKKAGSKNSKYTASWGGWIYLDFYRFDGPEVFFKKVDRPLQKLESHVKNKKCAFISLHLKYNKKKYVEWKKEYKKFEILVVKKYWPARGRHLKATHDELEASREYFKTWKNDPAWIKKIAAIRDKKTSLAKKEQAKYQKEFRDAWSKIKQISQKFEYKPVVTMKTISSVRKKEEPSGHVILP